MIFFCFSGKEDKYLYLKYDFKLVLLLIIIVFTVDTLFI